MRTNGSPRRRTHPLVEGMMRVFDPFGRMNRPHPYEGFVNAADADAAALQSDWEAIGADFRRAEEEFERIARAAIQKATGENDV